MMGSTIPQKSTLFSIKEFFSLDEKKIKEYSKIVFPEYLWIPKKRKFNDPKVKEVLSKEEYQPNVNLNYKNIYAANLCYEVGSSQSSNRLKRKYFKLSADI